MIWIVRLLFKGEKKLAIDSLHMFDVGLAVANTVVLRRLFFMQNVSRIDLELRFIKGSTLSEIAAIRLTI